MSTEITIPDFQFASFYYAELLDALIEYKRLNVPEHTDESAYDPFMQFLRMQALVGHLNNTLIDLVANESTLPTAQLQETVRNMLQLIDYDLSSAVPAQADVVMKLTKVFNASFELVPQYSRTATESTEESPQIFFEDLVGLTIERTDQLGAIYAYEGTAYTDYTTEGNSQVTPGDDFTPWATPAVKDILYFGHKNVMWDKLGIWITTAASGITGVWEYYDGDYRKTAPTSVELDGSTLIIDLTSYLGTNPRPGTAIRVQYNETTAFEDLESQWGGGINYVTTTGYLGQTSPKYNTGGPSPTTDAETYYTVGSDWEIIDTVTDNTSNLTVEGDVDFDLPQTVTENWKTTTVNSYLGYWLRYRIVVVSTPSSPVLQYARIDQGDQYILRSMTQGRLQVDAPLGSSTGVANFELETNQDYYIDNTMEVYVEDELWSEVDNFLSSKATDKHYQVKLGDDDRATIVFGDGSTGKVPPTGVGNIEANYRWGANEDGNVGSNTITLDQTGLTYVSDIFNPRPASGWAQAEGATDESLAQAKISGPASLRTKDVAVGPEDVELMSVQYTDDNGASPFSRARAFEEGFGPKTVELVVVASGGNLASAEQIAALEEYFNGDKYASPVLPQRIVANQEVTVVNFTPKSIDITATVYGDVTDEQVRNRLIQVVQPEALRDDGVTYEWEFGEDVPISRIIHEIFVADEDITRVDLAVPSANVALASRELPVIGTITLTIVEP